MTSFRFAGEFVCAAFDFTETVERELVCEFGEIQLESDFYYWFVNQQLLVETAFSERVRQLSDTGEPEAAFALMFQEIVDAWLEIVRDGSGNLLVGFFDEGCQLIRTRSRDESTTHLCSYWTSEIHGYFGHPIDLQKQFGTQQGLELLDTDEPEQEVETNTLIEDLEEASAELQSRAASQLEGDS